MLGRVAAFVRHDALTTASYRVRLLFSLGGLLMMVGPLYFVARALQPMMGPRIVGQGGQYFSFVVLGIAAHRLVYKAAEFLPTAVQRGIRTGTLEVVFSTPTRATTIVAGMAAFPLLWTALEATLFVLAGLALGATFLAPAVLPSLLIVTLMAASYVPFGLAAAAMILAFRTPGPLLSIVSLGSVLFGGVYYPTSSIPGWLEHLASIVPLSYGLQALRGVALQGLPLRAVSSDLAVLSAITVFLLAASSLMFARALAYARASGTLGQY